MGEWWSNWIATLRKGHAIGDNSPLTVNSIAADDRIAELEKELAVVQGLFGELYDSLKESGGSLSVVSTAKLLNLKAALNKESATSEPSPSENPHE